MDTVSHHLAAIAPLRERLGSQPAAWKAHDPAIVRKNQLAAPT